MRKMAWAKKKWSYGISQPMDFWFLSNFELWHLSNFRNPSRYENMEQKCRPFHVGFLNLWTFDFYRTLNFDIYRTFETREDMKIRNKNADKCVSATFAVISVWGREHAFVFRIVILVLTEIPRRYVVDAHSGNMPIQIGGTSLTFPNVPSNCQKGKCPNFSCLFGCSLSIV